MHPKKFTNPVLSNVAPWAARAESLLYRFGAVVVFLTAIIYYSYYYRSGLNVGGEGGTVAVVAMRLMDGQIPMVETVLNYNVLWFFPVAWLFELTGPNYIALRIYFFALCTLTGLMSFFVVRRVTGSGLFSVLVAVCPVLIPGMMFRNYMGFLAVLNMLCLLNAWVFEQRTRRRQFVWMAISGAAVGVTYLVRIDLGAFFTVMLVGLAALFPFGKEGAVSSRLKFSVLGLLLAFAVILAVHVPFYADSVKRGYSGNFVHQYFGWIGIMKSLAAEEIKDAAAEAEPPPAKPAPVAVAALAANKPQPAAVDRKDTDNRDLATENYMQKPALEEADTFYDKASAIVIYLPVPISLLLVLPSGIILLVALFRRNFALRTDALVILITTGSALTLFAQYFFFRPDTPHLSEFMVPFMVAMACSAWVLCRWAATARPIAMLYAAVAAIICLADFSLYFYHAMPKESAGTVAAKHKRRYQLIAENGVDVLLKRQERDEFQGLCDVIKKYTKPGDYLVAYPYSPTVNFMTNRPSYQGNLYIDNAHNISRFYKETMAEIAKYKPAAIVIDNRDINHTEESRFSNWAWRTYGWIKKNYAYAGTFRRQEVYLRPDLYTPPPK